jgi:hypothetical protein
VGLDGSVLRCEGGGERGGEGCGWKPRAAAVIGAFIAAITGSEEGCYCGRLKRGRGGLWAATIAAS